MKTNRTLKYFKAEEFNGWFDQMSPELLYKLDDFRGNLPEGWQLRVSPVEGGVGRNLGHDHTSQHNVDRWGEVRAVDLFPINASGRYISTLEERRIVQQAILKTGFTGYGIYTDTKPGNMVHVDVREDRTADDPAKWSRIAPNNYGPVERVV